MRGSQKAGALIAERSAAGICSASWTWLGPGNIGGRVRAIVVQPAVPSTWFTGSVSGGIWKTVDSGGALGAGERLPGQPLDLDAS